MMVKKYLAVAIMGLCVVSYAQAEVTLYGIAQKSIDYGNSATGERKFSMQDIGSRVGFKGVDQLDNGSSLLWKLESGLSTFGSREAWIGYENKDAGTLRFGKSKGAYNLLVEGFDLFESNTTLANTIQDATYRSRHESAVYYATPANLGGFAANLNYVIDSGKFSGTAADVEDQKGYDASVSYTHSKFAVYAGTMSLKNVARSGFQELKEQKGSKVTSYIVGAKLFPIEGLQIGAAYQNTKQDLTTGGDYKRDSAILMAQYEVGKWVPRVGYVYQGEGKLSSAGGQNLAKAGHFQIGTDYNLSKSSLLYVEGAVIQNKDQNAFSTSISDGLATTPKVISTGMILLF
ncbi:porin [Iodobacter ciconiae]|uniref:Porin n=1 Tax=Iodobacter ciconiae TaxID=2496266 RepID=A0A3S8ZRC6_9NEIS|nr:porin [Iodobacter ciconiae]AZN36036.1 porin [Iodobacter ciconiae]